MLSHRISADAREAVTHNPGMLRHLIFQVDQQITDVYQEEPVLNFKHKLSSLLSRLSHNEGRQIFDPSLFILSINSYEHEITGSMRSLTIQSNQLVTMDLSDIVSKINQSIPGIIENNPQSMGQDKIVLNINLLLEVAIPMLAIQDAAPSHSSHNYGGYYGGSNPFGMAPVVGRC